MRRLHPRRPSPGLVIAVIALFVALGGTGYAALSLPKNSVGSKQIRKNAVIGSKIKKNAVTGSKVKDQSLTGADINLGSLGTVPNAAHAAAADNATNAGHAGLADNVAAPEGFHLLGAPGEPSFENGNTNFGPLAPGVATEPAGFYKDKEGMVHLQGFIKMSGSSATLAGVVFHLPAGYRPAAGTILVLTAFCQNVGTSTVCNNETTPVIIAGPNTASGGTDLSNVVLTNNGTPDGNELSLDGLSFRAAS
jgi:hypothetical protein